MNAHVLQAQLAQVLLRRTAEPTGSVAPCPQVFAALAQQGVQSPLVTAARTLLTTGPEEAVAMLASLAWVGLVIRPPWYGSAAMVVVVTAGLLFLARVPSRPPGRTDP